MKYDSHSGDFYRLIREFSSGFIKPTADKLDADLCSALGKIAELAGFDIAALASFSEHGVTGRTIGVWQGPNLAKTAELPEFECPWVVGEIRHGKILPLHNLTALDPIDRTTCSHLGLHTIYGVPLFGNSNVVGGIVLGAIESERKITAELVDQLQILGQLLIGTVLQVEREVRLSDAIEAAETGLWSLDFASMTFWATVSARSMHGFNATEMIGLEKVISGVHPDDRELIQQTILQAKESPQDVRIEYRVVLADNTLRWLIARGRSYNNASGVPQQLMGVCLDITERKQADEELRNARALTDAVFDSVPGLLYLYTEDGKLIRWNKQHENMTGYSAAELLNFPATNWFAAEDLPKLQLEWSKVFSEGHTSTELDLRSKDGTYAPFSFTGVRVVINDKPHLVGIGVDITNKLRTEATLAQLRRELAHTTRLTTLGELVSTLAHELNQPLAAILSNAQATRRLLAEPVPDLEEIRAAVDDIVRDDKRAGEIVHGLRGLISKGDVKSTRLDINTLVRGVADLLHGECVSSDVPLVLELEPELPMIEAGKTEVQQVLLNLMVNGITAQRVIDPDARRLTVSTTLDASNVIVAVRDRGIGIAADVLPKLFQPFFSTKSGGLGMGLAICKRIAESYHGKVWAENNSDGGASFYLALPRAESRI